MKRVLFTHSYFLQFDPKQKKLGQPYAPLGTLYAAALMRSVGYEVSVVDTMFSDTPAVINKALEQKPDYLVIYDDGFNYLTKMCLTNMREAAFAMIRQGKSKGCKVVVASSDASDHFDYYLAEGADVVIIGEAEHTLVELVGAVESNRGLSSVQGIAYMKDNVPVKTLKREVLKDLDALPLPAWDLIDLKPYRKTWMQSTGYFSLNIATTRGCPFKCNWCAKPIYGNRYHSRSPEHVVAELRMLKDQYGFDHIWFCDDIFGLKPGWVDRFADLLQKEGIRFRFKIQSRADLLVQENYVASLKRAGCETVWMGAESGSQNVLDAMDKGITVQQIEKATALLKQHQIRPAFFIQFGYLGETKEDIRQTVRMINRLLPAEIGISVSYPLPGTGFYEKVKQDLKEKANWSDSDDLALMFHNAYSPAYYKQLHRYVHKSYRTHMAWDKCRQLLKNPLTFNYAVLKKALAGFYYLPATLYAAKKLKALQKI